jgi:hypothetical protein
MGEFRRKRMVRKRFARLPEGVAFAIQRPIPDKPTCACKLIQERDLRISRVKPVAIGCLYGSCHGVSIPENTFYYKRFSALERHI